MTPADARAEAIRRLGGTPNDAQAILRQSGEHRERRLRIQDAIDDLRADTGFALRALRRSPGWTAVALLTIALGVGATTTTFGVADALLLRPITYPGASRVYVVRREVAVGKQNAGAPISLDGVREWRNARTIWSPAVLPVDGGCISWARRAWGTIRGARVSRGGAHRAVRPVARDRQSLPTPMGCRHR